jgi:hypothetical protein
MFVLPPERRQYSNEIYAGAGSRFGCLDVFAWKGNRILFAESKRKAARQDSKDAGAMARGGARPRRLPFGVAGGGMEPEEASRSIADGSVN